MKTLSTITDFRGTEFPEVESKIAATEAELTSLAHLLAKEDAEIEGELSEVRFTVNVVEPVVNKVQRDIYNINSMILPTAVVATAKESESLSITEVSLISKDIRDFETEKASLVAKRDSLSINRRKKKLATFLMPFAFFAGLCDTILTYVNVSPYYEWYWALITSLAVGCTIALGHIPLASWITKSNSEIAKVFKLLGVAILGWLLFWAVGSFRADIANDKVNIGLNEPTISIANSYQLNAIAIAAVSFILFFGVLIYAVSVRMTKREEDLEQEYDKLQEKIAEIDTNIVALRQSKKAIIETNLQRKHEARNRFNYASSCVRRLKMISDAAILKYKQTYIRHRCGSIPVFFTNPISHQYDDGFHFFTTENN